MRTSVKTLTVGSVLAVSLLAAPAAFAADTDATATVTGGALAVTATPAVDLGTVAASHDAQALSGTVEVGVDDNRGTGAGWSVTQQVGDFAYTGGNGGTAIPAANFSVDSVGAVTPVAGVDGAETVTPGAAGALDVARPVLSAAAGDGEGSYTAPVSVELTVPAGSRAGNYAATITTTSAPAI